MSGKRREGGMGMGNSGKAGKQRAPGAGILGVGYFGNQPKSVEGEFSELARRKLTEFKVAEAGAVECENFATLTGEHAADLVVAALGEGQFGCA
jgi:hypothetical protein